ncbi:hypothetical protein [Actinoplanes sp. HUAS TT8]|uniref:hypothetical protein n=1 Tax=Actinoplanes sp. HUAS TT8 TaxID=3447453 RepID=UPI003F521B32
MISSDDSWRLNPDGSEAVFRLTASGPGHRESELITALLVDPASAGLQRLELHLTDFHQSALAAAEAIAAHRRPRLTSLHFGHDFEYLFEDVKTSTGDTFDPLSRLQQGFADDSANGMWAALPALTSLTASGGLLFDDIISPTLTSLRLRGALFSDGSIFPTATPALISLQLEIRSDVFGTECPVLQLEELTPALFPALRHLDLSHSEFDESDGEVREVLAATGILAQLETFSGPGDAAQ